MTKQRLLEIAGIKKAVGKVEPFISEARYDDNPLDDPDFEDWGTSYGDSDFDEEDPDAAAADEMGDDYDPDAYADDPSADDDLDSAADEFLNPSDPGEQAFRGVIAGLPDDVKRKVLKDTQGMSPKDKMNYLRTAGGNQSQDPAMQDRLSMIKKAYLKDLKRRQDKIKALKSKKRNEPFQEDPAHENKPLGAREYIQGLRMYQDLKDDKRSKPQAIRTAGELVRELGSEVLNPEEKKHIRDELGALASEYNPRGAMLAPRKQEWSDFESDDEAEKAIMPTRKPRPKPGQGPGRKKASPERAAARQWLYQNPGATRGEFIKAAVDVGMAKNSSRSAYDKFKKEIAAGKHLPEWYTIRQKDSGKVLSEDTRPTMPHFVSYDDYDTGFWIMDSLQEARTVKGAYVLHSNEELQIFKHTED